MIIHIIIIFIIFVKTISGAEYYDSMDIGCKRSNTLNKKFTIGKLNYCYHLQFWFCLIHSISRFA